MTTKTIMMVPCSYGEIIDKLTILEIKLSKCVDDSKKKNIHNEYNALKHHKKETEPLRSLFHELKTINTLLWDCEDNIRLKSKLRQYDEDYISISEHIHQYNDQRYAIKRKINEQYHSYITEEKIYNLI